jgi:carboxylate-amine ligase
MLICGMHVHVGIENEANCAPIFWPSFMYFLPHLLALSSSSPYWQGQDTGLASYRLTDLRQPAAHRPSAALRNMAGI